MGQKPIWKTIGVILFILNLVFALKHGQNWEWNAAVAVGCVYADLLLGKFRQDQD